MHQRERDQQVAERVEHDADDGTDHLSEAEVVETEHRLDEGSRLQRPTDEERRDAAGPDFPGEVRRDAGNQSRGAQAKDGVGVGNPGRAIAFILSGWAALSTASLIGTFSGCLPGGKGHAACASRPEAARSLRATKASLGVAARWLA